MKTQPAHPAVLTALLAAVCALAIAAHTPDASAQQSPLTISGKVVNASPDSDHVAGIAVVLHMQGETTYDSDATITDNDGNFTFDGIIYDPALVYGVSVRYQDTIYGAEVSLPTARRPP